MWYSAFRQNPIFWKDQNTKKISTLYRCTGRCFTESMTTHRQTTGRHDNSATALFHRQPTRRHDHWPTRQVTYNFFKNSPTLTDRDFPRKRMKRNIFLNVNIALFSERTHHHFAFSKHKYMYIRGSPTRTRS